MAKTDGNVLSNHIAEELITYLAGGEVNTTTLTRTLDYTGLNIEAFERLKQLHFVLAEDVATYIERLPKRLRRLKSIHRNVTETTDGEIRGRIEWPQTLARRFKAGANDPTLFVTASPAVEYDIPENRVVKTLLAVIAEALTGDIEGVDYEWRKQWDDADIVQLQHILANNIYLDNLPDATAFSVTDRDLVTARRSRHRLYWRGAELYRLYDDLLNDRYQDQRVQDMLEETLITPAENHRLFELFCLFGIIRQIRVRWSRLELQRIQPGMKEIAVLESNKQRIAVYYDRSGPLQFFEPIDVTTEEMDRLPESLRRHVTAMDTYDESIGSFLGHDQHRGFYAGRPDFLVLRYDRTGADEVLVEATVGEVKYSKSEKQFANGLKELTEYLHFAREHQQYLFNEDRNSSVTVRGLLCTDGVDTEQERVGEVRHVTTAALRSAFDT